MKKFLAVVFVAIRLKYINSRVDDDVLWHQFSKVDSSSTGIMDLFIVVLCIDVCGRIPSM